MALKGSLLTTGSFLGGGFGGLAAGGTSLLGGTALGAFGGPIGAAAGLGVALWIKGQAHRKANEWVKKYQNPWGDAAIGFMDRLNASRVGGTLTYEDALQAQKEFDANVNDFWDQASMFSIKGGDHAKVISQAHNTLDPTIDAWRKTIQSHIDALAPNPTAGIDETTPPGPDPEAGAKAAAAAERQRKRSLGMKGRSSTILTGPMGTRERSSTRRPTLLGY